MAKPKIKNGDKFIVIEESGQHLGHPCFDILNKKTEEKMGVISWHPDWKTYIFSTGTGYYFDAKCLEDIVDFMKNEIQ